MIISSLDRYLTGPLTILFSIFLLASSGAVAAPDNAPADGDAVPSFQLNDHTGALWSLSEQVGDQPIVLFFYPAAMTSGCTKQACSYRDQRKQLEQFGVRVIGISGDPVKNLQIFRKEHNLNYTLLSDPDGSVAHKFGVPIGEGGSIQRIINDTEQTLTRGATFDRWTFVIDRNGTIAYINRDVTPEEDPESVRSVLRDLNQE